MIKPCTKITESNHVTCEDTNGGRRSQKLKLVNPLP